jgi:hypothetical protein
MLTLILFLFLEIVTRPKLGQIYIIKQSIDNLFELVARRSTSSTRTKKQGEIPRPCLIWNSEPIN